MERREGGRGREEAGQMMRREGEGGGMEGDTITLQGTQQVHCALTAVYTSMLVDVSFSSMTCFRMVSSFSSASSVGMPCRTATRSVSQQKQPVS